MSSMDFATPVDLTPFEAEHFIEHLEEVTLDEIGTKKFLDQHEKVEKLQALAHYQAEDGTDEFIVDFVNTHDKMGVLVHNLVTIETWKENVYPLLKEHIAPMSSVRSYVPLYNEASILSLLEMCLYSNLHKCYNLSAPK